MKKYILALIPLLSVFLFPSISHAGFLEWQPAYQKMSISTSNTDNRVGIGSSGLMVTQTNQGSYPTSVLPKTLTGYTLSSLRIDTLLWYAQSTNTTQYTLKLRSGAQTNPKDCTTQPFTLSDKLNYNSITENVDFEFSGSECFIPSSTDSYTVRLYAGTTNVSAGTFLTAAKLDTALGTFHSYRIYSTEGNQEYNPGPEITPAFIQLAYPKSSYTVGTNFTARIFYRNDGNYNSIHYTLSHFNEEEQLIEEQSYYNIPAEESPENLEELEIDFNDLIPNTTYFLNVAMLGEEPYFKEIPADVPFFVTNSLQFVTPDFTTDISTATDDLKDWGFMGAEEECEFIDLIAFEIPDPICSFKNGMRWAIGIQPETWDKFGNAIDLRDKVPFAYLYIIKDFYDDFFIVTSIPSMNNFTIHIMDRDVQVVDFDSLKAMPFIGTARQIIGLFLYALTLLFASWYSCFFA